MIVAPMVSMPSRVKYSASVRPTIDANLTTMSGVRTFDLAHEAQGLAHAQNPERIGRTIARLGTLRLTVMNLKAGSIVQRHKTDHELSIQTVSGHVALRTELEQVDLPAGRVAILERDVVHDIEAHEDSAILITVCMTPSITS